MLLVVLELVVLATVEVEVVVTDDDVVLTSADVVVSGGNVVPLVVSVADDVAVDDVVLDTLVFVGAVVGYG